MQHDPLEGILFDALILKGVATADGGHKVFELNADGTRKLNKWGKPVELRGAGVAIKRLAFEENTAHARAAEYIARAWVGDRNGILHGRNTQYAKPKLSAQTIVLIYIFTKVARTLEDAD